MKLYSIYWTMWASEKLPQPSIDSAYRTNDINAAYKELENCLKKYRADGFVDEVKVIV